MKKKVDYITISNKLADFLIKSLNSDEFKSTGFENEKSELKNSITELITGQTNSLVLDCETSAPFVYDDVIRAENFEIYRKERKVLKNGTEIPLTPKEFDILFFLASNRGEVFTKERLNQMAKIAPFDLTRVSYETLFIYLFACANVL